MYEFKAVPDKIHIIPFVLVPEQILAQFFNEAEKWRIRIQLKVL
jgi:hypothetical protein